MLAHRRRDIDRVDVGVHHEVGVGAMSSVEAEPFGERARTVQVSGADGDDLLTSVGEKGRDEVGSDNPGTEDAPPQRRGIPRVQMGRGW